MELTQELRNKLVVFQQREMEGHLSYQKLAKMVKTPANRAIIERISDEEIKHYKIWKKYTGKDVKPNRLRVFFYYLVARLFGFTFGIKLMERGENATIDAYEPLKGTIPEVDQFLEEERKHEQTLIDMLDEESLQYAGSIVLGLSDALVELTGTLAGLTLAFQNTGLIALSGLITGIAAALSMAASEYLSTKSEDTTKTPLKSAVYTGVTYVITVALLILPYLIFKNYYLCLALTLTTAVLIIAGFNYYISVAKDEPFRKRFLGMAGLSLGVAALSFIIGYLIRRFLGIEI